MFGFKASESKEELALVFDIGSASVGGALFAVQNSGIPKIIYSFREPITLESEIDADKLFSLTLKSLEVVAGKVATAGVGVPGKVFCVLSAPWYISQARVISMKNDVPFVFTSKLADELIQKEVKLFEETFFAKYVNAGSPIRSIELRNIKTTLNGYETHEPIGQKANELEMHIFISMSSEDVVESIEAVLGKHFIGKKVTFSSFAMASFIVVRDAYTHPENFLLVDVAGEMTDITMVKKNALRESASFPYGRNFLIRGMATNLGCSLGEAQSCISLIKDGHASDGTMRNVEPVVNKLKKEWLQKFQESLANLSSDISVPATIYLSVDEDLADFFSETIKTEQFSQYTLAESKFEVIFLNAKLFHGLAAFEETVVRDPFLIISAVYINRFIIHTSGVKQK